MRGKKKRKDVVEFSLNFNDNLFSLAEDLKKKTYRHGGYQAFKINDPKPRDIHKASVRDRLVHHAIYRILYPYFDKKFIFDSYSCRIKKGTHRAINRFRDFARKASKNNKRTAWVLKCDIRKFFASIDHKTLKDILATHIGDEDVLWHLSKVIDSFSSFVVIPVKTGIQQPAIKMDPRLREDDEFNIPQLARKVGLPLGNLTSQLLVNIYMNELDQFVKRDLKVKYYIRYADDFVILEADRERLANLLPKISEFLESRLRLTLHPDKVFIKTIDSGLDFLGWVCFPHHRVLRTSTKRRILGRLRYNIKTDAIASYLGLLKHGNTIKLQKLIFCGFPPPRE